MIFFHFSEMASAQPLCDFSSRRTTLYPQRYDHCGGELVAIEACQETEPETGYSESSLILLRSGQLKEYDKGNQWRVCEKHRASYGLRFAKEFMQKKCFFPGNSCVPTKAKLVEKVSFKHSKGLLYKENMIMPYGIKICKSCNQEITRLLKDYEEEEEMDSQEFSQSSKSTTVSPPSSGSSWRPTLDLGLSDTPSSSQETSIEKTPRNMVIDLIRTIEPEFDKGKNKKQAMWTAQKPLHQLKKTATFKMKKTVGLSIKATIMALSNCPEDHPKIYELVKDSRVVEEEFGQKAAMDSYMKEIILAHNKVSAGPRKKERRIQILSLIAKRFSFGYLKKFNPPAEKKTQNRDAINDTTLKGTVILAQSSDCVVGAAPRGASETIHDENESEDDDVDEDNDEDEDMEENVDAGGDTSDLDK